MDSTQLTALYEKLTALRAEGKESEARALLIKKLEDLPESVQAEIMLEMFISTMEKEADGLEALARIQEDGLAAAEILENAKAQQAKKA